MKNLLCILLWILLGVLDLCAASFGQSVAFQGAAAIRPTAGGGGGGITYVQGTGAQSSDGNTVAASFASTPTAGTTVIVAMAYYDEAIANGDVTDNQGNTYTNVAAVAAVTHTSTAFFICNNVASSGTFTVTVSGGAATYPAIHISEWSGVNNGAVTTDTSSASGTSTAPAPGIITSPTGGYIIAVTAHDNGGNPAITPPGGWTNPYEAEDASGNSVGFSVIYKSSSTDETPAWTLGSSSSWTASAIAIQP